MNATLVRALAASVPTGLLLVGSAALFRKTRTVPCLLQLLGAGGVAIVIFAHVCEALGLLQWMQWGEEHSTDHYIDLTGALLGIIVFPVGFLLYALTTRSAP
jgi:hypothetical protein